MGSVVLQVTALDKDKGKNAEVVYSIESGIWGALHGFINLRLLESVSFLKLFLDVQTFLCISVKMASTDR